MVTAAEEYPSNLYPWMNLASRGVALRQVASRDGRIWIEDLAAAMDDSTRVLAISHVEFASRFRNDLDALAELCRDRGVALFVDAIQGLGPLRSTCGERRSTSWPPTATSGCSGPRGPGSSIVRRDWIDRLRPIGVGWHSVVGSYNSPRNEFRLKPSARRWEGGSFNMPGLLDLRRQPGVVSRAGARRGRRGGSSTGRRPSASWPPRPAGRSSARRAQATVRRSWCSRRPGVDPTRRRPRAAPARGSSLPAGGDGSGSARTSTIMTTDLERLRAGLADPLG